MPASIDASGLIPPSFSTAILEAATEQSIALTLGRRIPIPGGVTHMPIPATFPNAAWTSVGARKTWTDFTFDEVTMVAEEIAAVITIPDTYLADSSVNLWNYARPLLSEAIATGLDEAVIWGINAPTTFPPGGVVGVALQATSGADVIDTVNNAMSLVEAEGLRITGSAADLGVAGLLRGVRDDSGALLLGPGQVGNAGLQALYGYPIRFSPFAAGADDDFITGDWNDLIIGVRQDMRFAMSQDFTLADEDGNVLVTGFQDNQTAMKVWARYGAVIVKPRNRRTPDGAIPFAKADLGSRASGSGGTGDTRKAAPAPAPAAKKASA